MNEENTELHLAHADTKVIPAKKSTVSLVSTVWLIPLVSIIIVIWLFVDYMRTTGPEITLYIQNGDGLAEGTSVIKMLDVNVGKITSISLNKDSSRTGKGVVLKAQMSSDVKDLLREDAEFWVVKPRIERSGVSGLSTLISGSYIQMYPGNSEVRSTEFVVTDKPPITASTIEGLHLWLEGNPQQLLSMGAPVVYKGVEVGSVESVNFDPVSKKANYKIVIDKANQELVGSNVNFWLSNGFDLSIDNTGVSLNQLSVANLLSGVIEFAEPPKLGKGEKVADNARFELYDSKQTVPNMVSEQALYAVAFFNQSISGLTAGALVEYKGVEVGKVLQAPYFLAADKNQLFSNQSIPVLFYFDPNNFDLDDSAAIKLWQANTKKAITTSLVASLASSNLLLGNQHIELLDGKKNPKGFKPKSSYGGHQVIASSSAGGLAEIQTNLNQLLQKLTALPLEDTFTNLNANLAKLQGSLDGINNLLNAQELQSLPTELRLTLQQLQQALKGLAPESALYNDLQQLLQQLNARPNALIFNKSSAEVQPKGYR